jgi:hypothetical protein
MSGPLYTTGSYKNISASAVIKAGEGELLGILVSSSTSGTLKAWDNATAASGTVIFNTTAAITAPMWIPCPAAFVNGLFITIGGTADICVVYR